MWGKQAYLLGEMVVYITIAPTQASLLCALIRAGAILFTHLAIQPV
jgi:hypothetical protein